MTSPSKTWKDEAIAFVLLAISIVFVMRAWDFFAASQKEKAPNLQVYTPRPKPEEVIDVPHRQLDYADYDSGFGYMAMGTETQGGRGIIIYQSNGIDGASRVYYR